nr:MAG TPA: hypothetical protein [Caudoviricetes sp.]
MITAKGMQSLLEHLDAAGVLISKPGQLQTWGGKISRKFPDATDADLVRAADTLDEAQGFVRLGDLVAFLNGKKTEADKLERVTRLALITNASNGGDLYPDADLTPRQYLEWLRVARAYAADQHPGMTPAEINKAAREHADLAVNTNTLAEINAPDREVPQLPELRTI